VFEDNEGAKAMATVPKMPPRTSTYMVQCTISAAQCQLESSSLNQSTHRINWQT
jgi:hypothetical protein